jgi:hypothetical protein
MVQINFALKEVNCKIVYYGPGLSGKTTNLEVVHSKAPKSHCGELTSIATEGDRTLFFDFLPLNLGKVAGMNTKFQIYTVPGQVYYNSTRKLVLQGADGIVFVADSRRSKIEENLESLQNLEENLKEYGMDISSLPLVIQYNKRDLPDVLTVDDLEKRINRYGAPYFEAVAVTGDGVFPTLKKVSSMVLENLNKQHSSARLKTKPGAQQARDQQFALAKVGAKETVEEASEVQPSRKPRATLAAGREGLHSQGVDRADVQNVRVRERVTRVSGVQPVERSIPNRETRGTGGGKARDQARVQSETPKRRSGTRVTILVVVVMMLIGVAALVYYSGIWKKLI